MSNEFVWDIFKSPFNSKEELDHVKTQVKWITKKNHEKLGIRYLKPVNRKQKKVKVSEEKRIDFDDGWYLNYTDNSDLHESFQTDHCLITVHGLPGRPRDFYYVEKELGNFCRVIGYKIPGFDGETEIRGNYRGTMKDNAELILRLMNKMGIKKSFLIMHSGGSVIGAKFAELYPERTQGILHLCSFGASWTLGFKTYFTFCVTNSGVFERGESILYDPEQRIKTYENFCELTKDVHFDGLPFQGFDIYSLHAFTKLMAFIKIDPAKNNIHKLEAFMTIPKILTLHFSCDDDPLLEDHTFLEAIELLINQFKLDFCPYHSRKLFGQDPELAKLIDSFDFNNFQSNFVFFEDRAGHQIFKTWANKIVKAFRVYSKVTDIIQKVKTQNQNQLRPQ